MPQNQISLNNTSNAVKLNVSYIDNLMSVQLNPDSIVNDNYVKGYSLVYESIQRSIGASPNTSIDLSKYLSDFKELNPNAKSIVLTVSLANYDGGGKYAYQLTGAGIQLPAQAGDVSKWTSQMDSYIINIFPA